MFSSWLRTQRSTPQRADGGSLTSRTESRVTRRCTRPASRVTRLRKITTISSLITHLNAESCSRKGCNYDRAQISWNFMRGFPSVKVTRLTRRLGRESPFTDEVNEHARVRCKRCVPAQQRDRKSV